MAKAMTGTGTELDPYVVYCYADLMEKVQESGVYIKIGADIGDLADESDADWICDMRWSCAKVYSDNPHGVKLRNITIRQNNIALFNIVKSCILENIHFENIIVTYSSSEKTLILNDDCPLIIKQCSFHFTHDGRPGNVTIFSSRSRATLSLSSCEVTYNIINYTSTDGPLYIHKINESSGVSYITINDVRYNINVPFVDWVFWFQGPYYSYESHITITNAYILGKSATAFAWFDDIPSAENSSLKQQCCYAAWESPSIELPVCSKDTSTTHYITRCFFDKTLITSPPTDTVLAKTPGILALSTEQCKDINVLTDVDGLNWQITS